MVFRLFVMALLGLLAGGCASVSVHSVRDGEKKPRPPEIIYVEPFETAPEVFRVDRGGASFERFRTEYANVLGDAITRRVRKRLAPAEFVARKSVHGKRKAWLVTGRFVRVNQGSRVLRTTVGFGLGGTKVETNVAVYDLNRPGSPPILEFSTTGGTNSQPGVIVGLVMPNFWLIGLDAAIRIGPGLQADGFRTSRQVVAVLSEYMARQGMLPPERVYRAKRLSKWP